GDRWRDVGAGRAAGCTTVLIECGYAEPERIEPDLTARDVAEAAALILDRRRAVIRPGERA
ncbi:MAG TPA: HAD hydrolase-like protein, partial [Thalassobaculum sp.]